MSRHHAVTSPVRTDRRTRQHRFTALAAAMLGACLVMPAPAPAHHAFTAGFDVARIIEIEGEVTGLAWQNPHVLMTVTDQDGTAWEVESQARNLLERTEIFADMFALGRELRLAGYPARRGAGIFALNALLPEGQEVILRAGVAPRFGREQRGNPGNILADGVIDQAGAAAGLFRVWSMQFAGPGRWRWPDNYRLTAAAEAARNRFDPVADNPLTDCQAKGMPWIMEQPFPMELIRTDDNTIEIRLEEDDVVRVVHLTDRRTATPGASALGYSTGTLEGNTLRVQTTAIDFPLLNASGIPLSAGAATTELFTAAADGSRLDYRLEVIDPLNLEAPVVVDTFWVWRPDVRLEPYRCVR